MKEWIISIVATVILTGTISLISLEGRMGSLIKTIYSIVITFTIISPLINDVHGLNLLNFDTFSVEENIYGDYLEYVNDKKIYTLKSDIVKICEENKISNVKVDVVYSFANYVLSIDKILLNFNESVIISDKEHIVIIEETISSIANKLNINKEIIHCNG